MCSCILIIFCIICLWCSITSLTTAAVASTLALPFAAIIAGTCNIEGRVHCFHLFVRGHHLIVSAHHATLTAVRVIRSRSISESSTRHEDSRDSECD